MKTELFSEKVSFLDEDDECYTIILDSGIRFVIDECADVNTNLKDLSIEGPSVISSHIEGCVLDILETFPSLETLSFKYLIYDMDWEGLSTVKLKKICLWSYESLARHIVFPADCVIDFSGLASWYQTFPMETHQFLRNALINVSTENFTWHVGYHYTVKI